MTVEDLQQQRQGPYFAQSWGGSVNARSGAFYEYWWDVGDCIDDFSVTPLDTAIQRQGVLTGALQALLEGEGGKRSRAD